MKSLIPNPVKLFVRETFGLNSLRGQNSNTTPGYTKNLLYEADIFFNQIYDTGLKKTETPEVLKRRERFYNLMQFFIQTIPLNGLVVECGCWKGLSSFMLCHYMLRHKPDFRGQDYHIFDSFEGLSNPTEKDVITDKLVTGGEHKYGKLAGAFAASMEGVQQVLSEFPNITYHPGWIPESFQNIPENQYKFVHIDVDLYEPIKGSIEYFYPRLVQGGMIIFDDYGSLFWPGAKKAVEEYCFQHSVPFITISTGQAIIWKR